MQAGGVQRTTNYKIVVPFYAYASISFFIGTVLLFFQIEDLAGHYFNPHTLATVHTMALGWGTMVILGASHQLLPVLIESKLDSDLLGYLTFGFAAVGIPILIYGFYTFQLGWLTQLGGTFVNIAIGLYVINVISSAMYGSRLNVHAWFIIIASLWLFLTTFFGLLLVFNFTQSVLPQNSVHYLSLHAHMGLVGWFLMLVMGVGSRLVPMFLISKYNNEKILWWIFGSVNLSLVIFVGLQLFQLASNLYILPIVLGLIGVLLFGLYCYKSYQVRIRKAVDNQMKTTLLSVAQMILPIIIMLYAIIMMPEGTSSKVATLYGFCIFFGWLTAIIIGMTFKTLPFIIWNVAYHKKGHKGKTPAPKDLFKEGVYLGMLVSYLLGFVIFALGFIIDQSLWIRIGAGALIVSAALYVANVGIVIFHQPKKYERRLTNYQ